MLGRTLGGALLAAAALGGALPGSAEAAVSCRMNVTPSVPSPYAATYVNGMTVSVRSKEGRTLSGLRAQLYTFKGKLLASGTRKGRVGAFGSARVAMRLRYPMQAGKLTLVVSELRGASCGTPKHIRVLTFRGCPGYLPIKLSRASPLVAGESDFSDVVGAVGGAFLSKLDSRFYDPSGALVGEAGTDVLFGRQTLDHALAAPLESGIYTQVITGHVDGLPTACPDASNTYTFGVA